MTQNQSSSAPELLSQARTALQTKAFERCVQLCQSLLELDRAHPEAHYLYAVALRYQRHFKEALSVLNQAIELNPRWGRLHQEIGHCHRDQNQPHEALRGYAKAVELNPALPASWRALAALYKLKAQPQKLHEAEQMLARLSGLHPTVVSAQGLYFDQQILEAEHLIRAYLLQHPDDIEAMRLLATIGLRLNVFDDAETLLSAVLERAPDYTAARYDYAQALMGRHKHQAALHESERLLAVDPANDRFLSLKGNALVGLGHHVDALAVFDQLLTLTPNNPTVHLAIAHAKKTIGHTQEAIESYRQAAHARVDFGDAYWSLANLKTYQFSEPELATMRAQLARADLDLDDRIHLCFAMGKACEDRKQFRDAFDYYAQGNALKHAAVEFDLEHFENTIERQLRVCTAEFFASRAQFGDPSAEPIFIVGLPRSGSTLLEQILASHSQVEGTRELAEIPRVVAHLNGREVKGHASRYPDVLLNLSAQEAAELGRQYLNDTRLYRSGKPYFIDKMPNNFRHIGLLKLMLPNAKVIDARREPMACCFSNFKQLFATGQEFTYSLSDLGRYYRAYLKVMAHWHQVLPGYVLTVQHEDVVADLESNVRRILEFCGLEFEQRCLKFYETERSVRTPSSEQVRRPIFKDGLDQWRDFEPWLGPLHAALNT